jgi:membrane protein
MIETITQFWQQSVNQAHMLNQRVNGWLGVFARAIRETLKPDAALTAAAISYFALLSLFPIAILSISIASFTFGPLISEQLILQRLEFVAPYLSNLLGQNIDEIIQTRGPVSVIALAGLVWSASTFFTTLTHTLHKIWSHKRNRPIWKQRGLAILFVLIFAGPALLLASFASSIVTNVSAWLPNQTIPILQVISFLVSILLDIGLFMLLYTLLPHGSATWRVILPGAMSAGLLWEVAKRTFLLFVSTYISMSNLVYGSVSAIIAFLLWAYLSGLIFLFGAFLSVSYYEHKQSPQKAETPILQVDAGN